MSVIALPRLSEGLRRPLRVVGIDLGTTNSAVAGICVTADGAGTPAPRCHDVEQPTRQGPQFDTLVPSVVALHDGQVYVGAGAKDLRARTGDFGLERFRNIFWDCKNDIGVRRTYHKAPAGYRSAKEIAGHVLKFLLDAASGGDGLAAADAAVVTVPASFQAAQRQDTLDAARLAGIELSAGALLDEPVAAFLDYVAAHPETFSEMSAPTRLVVFDFGGGTCDVAVFELRGPARGAAAGVGVAPLSISRYHRLGGGDIDRAIVVEVLIPQFVAQNGLQPHELDFADKADRLIPALLGCAESLKIGLCREIARLKQFGRYDEERLTLVQKNPGIYPCTLRDGSAHTLKSPTLSAVELDEVLKPFLDRDLLYPRETDYLMTCSVFAPLQDALERTRSRLTPRDVDLCLLVGGSSLIPQVIEAVAAFFPKAKLLRFEDPERAQTAVAHGAAWQAFSLAVRGRGIVQPVVGEAIHIQTANGPVELIGDGAELPFPSGDGGADDRWAEMDRLVVPETSFSDDVKLRVELRGVDDRVLMSQIWTIPPAVSRGDALRLRYRMDANQVLHLRLGLREQENDSAHEFQFAVENPLTNVVNPNATRDRILELEERMRTGEVPRAEQRKTVETIAKLEAELGHAERALHLLANLNQPTPDGFILHRMGLIAGRASDFEREEKFYREAARILTSWNGPLFNLALSQDRRGKTAEARQTIDTAIDRESDGPCLVFKAGLLDKREQVERDNLLDRAFAGFGPLAGLSDFELHWYGHGARLAGDAKRQQEAGEEKKRRGAAPAAAPDDGVLPDLRPEVAARER